MVRKSCEQCGNEAVITVCWLLSTVGLSPRVQKCSKASAFCFGCLNRLCESTCSLIHLYLRQRLSEAYTASSREHNALPEMGAQLKTTTGAEVNQ